ncbi:MAG TPA: methylated-DNA--[protein]-cysteine S-methyltransferase [Gammaproteobacteria bacterium]|jgi:AraC family transcriptional regulator of adaptative response/methylated-DNA-[protein]-cysteine methyltransferase|nr:methylated-DNA--[protein]-cysteine S-methyltransferase [Gammaproteobacteria bacterium]
MTRRHITTRDRSASVAALLDVCRHVDADPTGRHDLKALARRAGVSTFQLHRLFKSSLGITPREYVEQARVLELKRRLRAGAAVTEAIYDAGFESSSTVYGRLDVHLGMTPRSYRRGGANEAISFAFGTTTLGHVLIGATDRGICYLQFGDSQGELLEQLTGEFPNAEITASTAGAGPEFGAWMRALNAHLSGKPTTADLPLDIRGTAFQKRVWEFLRTIPYGTVASYTDVARGIGAPKAVRAAASACARNRIGVLIPCHRVLRGTGEIGGYRWGLPRKRRLLEIEGPRRGVSENA